MPVLCPSPKFRAVGSDGLALVGGKLHSYAAGTSTPIETFTDFGLGTANTNPVILDARGEASVWLEGNYKLVLTDEDDVQIWSVDNIRDLTNSATLVNATFGSSLTITSTAVTWSGNPIHSGNHRFANNLTVNGNTALGDSPADTLTISPNAVTWSNNPTHSGNHTFSGATTLTGVAAFSANPTGRVTSGQRTPTFTAGSNCTAGTPGLELWVRVGDYIVVDGLVSGLAVTAASTCVFQLDTPITTAFSNANQAVGVGVNNGTAAVDGNPKVVYAEPSTSKVNVQWTSGSATTGNACNYHYTYRVI